MLFVIFVNDIAYKHSSDQDNIDELSKSGSSSQIISNYLALRFSHGDPSTRQLSTRLTGKRREETVYISIQAPLLYARKWTNRVSLSSRYRGQ